MTRKPNVLFVLITLAIDAFGIGIMVPVVPALTQHLSGLPPSGAAFWQGWLVATFAAAQFFCGPIIGGLSDRFGRRVVILTSVGGLGCGYVLLAWAPTLGWLFVARAIAGATAANASAANAYIADITPPANRARRFGLVGAVFGGAFIFGPAIGGLLGGIHLRLPFIVSAALAFLNLMYGFFVLPESLPPERRRRFDWRRANVFGSMHVLASSAAASRLAGAWACSWFGVGVMQAVFVLYTAERYGWGTEQNGIVLGLLGLTQVLVQVVLIRRVVPRLGERLAAVLGNLCSAFAYVIFAFSAYPVMVYIAAAVQSVGAIAGPSIQSLISVHAGPERQGEMQGAMSSMQGLTAIIAPVLGAFLFVRFAHSLPGAPFLAATVAFLISAVLVGGLREAVPDLEPRPAET
jgi:DHA1 family tetracycline resistance protein-like MFS transporter